MRHDVDVSLLGPVRLRGAEEPFRRSASLDLVVLLAVRRRGVSHAECAAALWPDRLVSAATVYSTASDLRRALGRDADGVPYVTRASPLRLRRAVGTDVERFMVLARSDDPDDACRALTLVRGPVLDGLRRSDWAVFDGTKAAIESLVVRTAADAAAMLLSLRRPDEAEWAARRGLAASPFDERLYRAVLRATAAQGSRVRLHATMAELQTLAARGESPVSAVGRGSAMPACPEGLHPWTTGLYRDLLLGTAAAGGHPDRL